MTGFSSNTPNGFGRLLFDDPVPGVECVAPATGVHEFGVCERRVLGALHRRLWSRWIELKRAQQDQPVVEVDSSAAARPIEWSTRLERFSELRSASLTGTGRAVVSVRGWHEREEALLVDGRAVPACMVDVAAAFAAFVEPLREGHRVLTVVHPEPTSPGEAELWDALLTLAHDRLGIERGTVEALCELPDSDQSQPLAS